MCWRGAGKLSRMPSELAPLFVTLSQSAPIPLDVALACRPGELLALVGPSGSGKSTVLRAIAGLYRAAAGRIASGGETWFDGEAGIMVAPQVRAVGLVFQDYALFPHLSALDNVRLAMHHLAEPERRAAAAALLARVHLDGLEARTPDQLSGGQRQRVAIARALAREPKVLLLDEPFSAVDRMTREPLKDELAALRGSLAIPIVLVTHDLEEAQALADRISVIHGGRTRQTGSPDDVRLRPASPLVARLMGQTNLFEGEVEEASRAGAGGSIRWGDRRLQVAETGEFRKGDRVAWLIPSDFVAMEMPGAEATNTFAGTLTGMQALGERTALTVCMQGAAREELRFNVATREVRARTLTAGSAMRIRLLPEGVHLMTPTR
jgi:molybdate transport system ATP-binding protein